MGFRPEILSAKDPNVAAALKEAPVAVACMQNGNLSLLVLSPLSKLPNGAEKEVAILPLPTQQKTELKNYQDGESIFFGAPADGANFAKFGKRGYQKMIFNGKPAELNSFQQAGEPWFCVIDGTLYQEVAGKAVAVAEAAFRSYTSENGEERRAMMTRRPEEKWCFESSDGKVYLQETSGKISRIGSMEWRVVSLPQGEKTLMIMTRGMGEKSGWIGRHDGKIYMGK